MLSLIRARAVQATRMQAAPLRRAFAGAASPAFRAEFDGDSGDWTEKEVTVHERQQTRLTDAQKMHAKQSDYDGDHRSHAYSTGLKHPQTAAEREEFKRSIGDLPAQIKPQQEGQGGGGGKE